jgi:hypothetical protein
MDTDKNKATRSNRKRVTSQREAFHVSPSVFIRVHPWLTISSDKFETYEH